MSNFNAKSVNDEKQGHFLYYFAKERFGVEKNTSTLVT